MKYLPRITIGLLLAAAFFVAGIRTVGHTFPRFRLTHYITYKVGPPGLPFDGGVICPDGCSMMEVVGKPATVNGVPLIGLLRPTRMKFCSTLELVDYEGRYSEGSEIVYDSCGRSQ